MVAPSLSDAGIYLIPVDQITIPKDRLRSLKPAQAAAIGAAMAADRQYSPISVVQLPGRSDYELVDGLHRLEGARAVGMASIEATLAPQDKAARVREEILSAWARAGDDVFDRSAQTKALAELSRVASPTIGQAADGDASATIAQALRWDEATAKVLGISRSAVFNALRIARSFTADEIELLRREGYAAELVPLLLLIKQEPRVIRKVLAWIESRAHATDPNWPIQAIIDKVTGRQKPDAPTKRLSVFINTFTGMERWERIGATRDLLARAGADERAAAVEELAKGVPAGWRIERIDGESTSA